MNNLIILRVVKSKSFLPLVYFQVNGIYYRYTLKNFDVKSLKEFTTIDMRYTIGHLNHIVNINLPRLNNFEFEWDKLDAKSQITDRQYKDILSNSIELRGWSN